MQRVLQAGGSDLRHVFLCEDMAHRYAEVYGAPARSPWILSNAAFVPPGVLGRRAASTSTRLVIGHLSNLTREKGLHTFLALFCAAREQGLEVHALLAGPAPSSADRAAIAKIEAEFPQQFRYLGAVVGAAKSEFYQQIDLFLFPTEYPNEAQPVVLFEAAAHGNLLVSNLRGCIACQLVGDALRVEHPLEFIPATLRWIGEALARPEELPARRQRALEHYRAVHQHALRQLQALASSW
jgi:glycosyltransferase involved in cell wall biosynthesis